MVSPCCKVKFGVNHFFSDFFLGLLLHILCVMCDLSILFVILRAGSSVQIVDKIHWYVNDGDTVRYFF